MTRRFSAKLAAAVGLGALAVACMTAQTATGRIESLSSSKDVESAAERGAIEPGVEPGKEVPNIALDPASLLPDLPPIPAAKATLVGGTIEKLDRIEDRITVQVFGGGKTNALFDGRTHVYCDGRTSTLAVLKTGDRVYVDTILLDGTVFARNIRVRTAANEGESQGIILAYRPSRNELVVRDVTAPQPLKLRLTPSTRIMNGGRSSSAGDLAPGTLVAVEFGAERNARDTVRQISILALPGAAFTFTGRVTFLDLHNGILVLASDTNQRTYEISLGPLVRVDANLREGAEVMAQTRFDQDRYVAESVTVQSGPEN